MTEKEIRAEMKQGKWSFLCRKRRSKAYVYAARKVKNRRIERYICPLAEIADLSRSALVVKLNFNAPSAQANESHTRGEIPVVQAQINDMGLAG